jgi:tetratricopeptide (TPR) repeat protein
MNNTWTQIVFGAATIYFGLQTLRITPTLLRLLAALVTGVVKWPGPRIHDPDSSASNIRARLGIGYQNLFSTFVLNTISLLGAFAFSGLTFLSGTSLLRGHIRTEWKWDLVCLVIFALTGGWLAQKKSLANAVQVNTLLSDLNDRKEPRSVDGQSAEAAYAIEHPLIGHKALKFEQGRALDLYYESVRCHQDGNEPRAILLYQEATQLDPSLHKHAYNDLSKMVEKCSKKEAGAIFYWLGIHSEYLNDWEHAKDWYEKAASAYHDIGYLMRESRVHCNLGNIKMRLHDPTAMDEIEKAIELNPRNGIAHLNIARLYYRISDPGDERYEMALDAFADAIIADPLTYGPRVISSLREIGYTWKEDLEEITKRVEKNRKSV